MRNKNLLLAIDMQNDFCTPNGSLYIKGAEKDTDKLCSFIIQNREALDNIVLTQDNHHIIDISHPTFWTNAKGKHPNPFTIISEKDINDEKWIPLYFKNEAIKYIRSLAKQDEFPHTIWPEHCIIGSKGAAIVDNVIKAVSHWARKGNFFKIIRKGTNPLTEHFGVLRANIPNKNDKKTLLNQELTQTILQHKNIFIAGEAKSHCVANTVKQILELEKFNNNLYLLDDTMSNVEGFEELSSPIYFEAQKKGVKFIKTTDIKL